MKAAKTKLDVYSADGKVTGRLEIPKAIMEYKLNRDLLHQAVRMYLANLRRGGASTRVRREVSGGGKKPWRQKGTGRARVGSIRNPIWRGGGIVFGPHPRDYSYNLPLKMKKRAAKEALIDKIRTDALTVMDKIEIDKPKTRELGSLIKRLKLNGKGRILVLADTLTENLKMASRNLSKVTLKKASDASAYDILRASDILAARGYIDGFLRSI